MRAAFDIIFFKFRGGGQVPILPPLAGDRGNIQKLFVYVSCTRVSRATRIEKTANSERLAQLLRH